MPFNLATTTSSLDHVIYASHAYVWPPLYVVWGNKWPQIWLTHWPNEYILVNTQDGEPRSVDSITLVRLPSTQWYCSAVSGIFGRPENTVTLRGEFERQLRADRVKGFNGTHSFNEVQRLQ